MELSQQVHIPLPPDAVWRSLNDPEILKRSLPGCEEFTRDGSDRFQMVLLAKVGPVKARFNGELELKNVNAPTSYTLAGAGKGGVAGFAKGHADVRLEARETSAGLGTIMSYNVHAEVGGKLAQIGSRLVSAAAKKIAKDFFDNFVHAVCATNDSFEVQMETLSTEEAQK